MGADRNFAQRGPGSGFAAGVDGGRALRPDHISIGVGNQGRNSADAIDAGHHAGADLKIDNAPVLRRGQRRIVEIILCLPELSLHVGDGREGRG